MIVRKFLAAFALLGACSTSTSPKPASAPVDEIVARELRKWDLVFGTKAQRDTVMAWYAPDFLEVAASPTGVVRMAASDFAGAPALPQLPPSSFKTSDVRVVRPTDNTIVVSYKVAGPGPAGPNWGAYIATVWALRDGRWLTVYYQETPTTQ